MGGVAVAAKAYGLKPFRLRLDSGAYRPSYLRHSGRRRMHNERLRYG